MTFLEACAPLTRANTCSLHIEEVAQRLAQALYVDASLRVAALPYDDGRHGATHQRGRKAGPEPVPPSTSPAPHRRRRLDRRVTAARRTRLPQPPHEPLPPPAFLEHLPAPVAAHRRRTPQMTPRARSAAYPFALSAATASTQSTRRLRSLPSPAFERSLPLIRPLPPNDSPYIGPARPFRHPRASAPLPGSPAPARKRSRHRAILVHAHSVDWRQCVAQRRL